jgi:hypothetical protein
MQRIQATARDIAEDYVAAWHALLMTVAKSAETPDERFVTLVIEMGDTER